MKKMRFLVDASTFLYEIFLGYLQYLFAFIVRFSRNFVILYENDNDWFIVRHPYAPARRVIIFCFYF